jgi:hypothetical protein
VRHRREGDAVPKRPDLAVHVDPPPEPSASAHARNRSRPAFLRNPVSREVIDAPLPALVTPTATRTLTLDPTAATLTVSLAQSPKAPGTGTPVSRACSASESPSRWKGRRSAIVAGTAVGRSARASRRGPSLSRRRPSSGRTRPGGLRHQGASDREARSGRTLVDVVLGRTQRGDDSDR